MKTARLDKRRLSWNGRLASLLAAGLLLIASVSITMPASADILFTEDFESYAPGSNLVGQGGWIEAWPLGSSVITVANGTFLPTRVLDGRASTGLGQLRLCRKITFPICPICCMLMSGELAQSNHNRASSVGERR
jgi:hypothetical protein